MKTAISMPDPVAARVKQAALDSGMNFSEFMTTAAVAYTDAIDAARDTERINAALQHIRQPDPSTEAAKMVGLRTVAGEEW